MAETFDWESWLAPDATVADNPAVAAITDATPATSVLAADDATLRKQSLRSWLQADATDEEIDALAAEPGAWSWLIDSTTNTPDYTWVPTALREAYLAVAPEADAATIATLGTATTTPSMTYATPTQAAFPTGWNFAEPIQRSNAAASWLSPPATPIPMGGYSGLVSPGTWQEMTVPWMEAGGTGTPSANPTWDITSLPEIGGRDVRWTPGANTFQVNVEQPIQPGYSTFLKELNSQIAGGNTDPGLAIKLWEQQWGGPTPARTYGAVPAAGEANPTGYGAFANALSNYQYVPGIENEAQRIAALPFEGQMGTLPAGQSYADIFELVRKLNPQVTL
jgi:hypothetical protein